MKQNTKTNLTMILAAVFIMILVIVTLIPATDEVEIKEVDPGDKYDGMDAKKFKALSEAEQKEYLDYCSKVVRRFNYHQNIILNVLPEVVGVNHKDNITSTEEINDDPEPPNTEIAEEVIQENTGSEKTGADDRPAEVVPDLKTKRAELSRENITQSDKTFVVDQWEAEIFRERILADEPTSMAVLAERFKISESEVLEIEGELIEKLNADIQETQPKKPESIQESIEEKLETKPESIQEMPASIEEKQETIQESKPEKPASIEESIQETATDNETITETVEETTEKREPGEHEKKCALCDAIIPKYPPNSKLCSNCKVKATEAGMKHKDFITQELAKKGGNDEA